MSLHILHCIQSLSWGGLELYTVDLIKNLATQKTPQIVFCSRHSRVAEELKNTPVELITFEQQKISKLKAALLIRKICRERNITHLHSHTRLDMWACALSLWGRKAPAHIYNLYMNALPKQDLVHRWLFSKIQALCSSSEFVLAEAKKNFPIAPEKLHLVRYGRDSEKYIPSPEKRTHLRHSLGITDNQTVFGTLCRIDEGKGVRELVEALELLSENEIEKTHMLIVGEPTIAGKDTSGKTAYESQSQQLTEWIDKKAASPRLKGHLHRIPFQKEYIPVLDALDVFVLGSHNETYSLSVLDAMLMQKPVIGTQAGGTTEQIGNNERGFLIQPKNPQSLAEALRFYHAHPEAQSTQGLAGRRWVLQQHSWTHNLEVTLSLYNSLLPQTNLEHFNVKD